MTQLRNASMASQAIPDHGRNWGEVYCRVSSTIAASPHLADAHTLTPVNAAAGGAVTLPAAANWPHKMVTYKKVDAGANPVTVSRAGADTIDGAVSVALANQYDAVTLVSDGVSTWHILVPGGWGGGGVVPPAGYCWLYCVANRTTYGGTNACANITSPGGDDNTALGYNAMNQNSTGDRNVAVGSYALNGQAGQNNSMNTAVGFGAGYIQGSSEGSATIVGAYAAYSTEVYSSVVIGESCAFGNGLGTSRFVSCVYIGNSAAFDNVDADENVGIGSNAMYRAESSKYNVCIGNSAGYGTNGSSWDGCVYVGSTAGVGADAGGDYNVGIGQAAAGGASFTGQDNVYIGRSSGGDAVAVVSGDYNVGVGSFSFQVISSGTRNTALGYYTAANRITTHTDGVFVGYYAGRNNAASYNVFVGSEAGEGPAAAGNTGAYNCGGGFESLTALTTGNYNSGWGYQSLASVTTGSSNTALGDRAGDLLTTGTHCILIGESTDPTANNATYELNIGNVIYGLLDDELIGIGTNAPATTLELYAVETLGADQADDYAACLTLDPGYTGAWTVTRHNYIDVNRPSVAGGAAVTDAAVMRFDDTIANHEALAASFNTTDSNADTTTWALGVIINVNGTLYKLPAIAV